MASVVQQDTNYRKKRILGEEGDDRHIKSPQDFLSPQFKFKRKNFPFYIARSTVLILNSQHKIILITGIIIYALLSILAFLYYHERTIFADVSFNLFYILKDCKPAIQNNRFGAIFTQLFPLVSAKLHLPLKETMIIYSEAFVLCNAAIFFLCFFLEKEKRFAGIMMLFSIFMVTDTFYWIQSELLQGISFIILFFAFLTRINLADDRAAFAVAVLILLLFTIVFIHPLVIFVFIFISLFMIIDVRFVAFRKMIWASVFLVIAMTVIKSKLMYVPGYDANAMETTKNFLLLFPHYFDLPSNIAFLNEQLTKFYLVPPALLIITVFYLRSQLYLKLVLCYAAFFGYLGLINISFYYGGTDYYMESLYLPLSVFLLVPLMLDVLPKLSSRFQIAILGFIVTVRIFSIQQYHSMYTAQIVWERNFLTKTQNLPHKKLILDKKDVPADSLLEWWASPYQFWLLSTLEDHETRSILVTDNPPSYYWQMEKNNLFLTKWSAPEYHELPPQYFVMRDSLGYIEYHPKQ
ncbi:MAG TPA: hypothetical protein VE978_05015 [Chitinophagales bacterium]|nr:hypothetical protein [Chitinophagales bacterium]